MSIPITNLVMFPVLYALIPIPQLTNISTKLNTMKPINNLLFKLNLLQTTNKLENNTDM